MLCVCCPGKEPVQGPQSCLGAHTHTGWAGRTLSLSRIANPHAYIKLCHGARQKQQDKSLNVAVGAFVLTKAKSKTSSEHAGYLGVNILSIFFLNTKKLKFQATFKGNFSVNS